MEKFQWYRRQQGGTWYCWQDRRDSIMGVQYFMVWNRDPYYDPNSFNLIKVETY